MESFIKSLSKIPSSILSILAFVLCVLVFYESILLVDLMLSYGYGSNIPSTVIDLSVLPFKILRKGAGNTPF